MLQLTQLQELAGIPVEWGWGAWAIFSQPLPNTKTFSNQGHPVSQSQFLWLQGFICFQRAVWCFQWLWPSTCTKITLSFGPGRKHPSGLYMLENVLGSRVTWQALRVGHCNYFSSKRAEIKGPNAIMICTKIFSFRSIFIYNLMPNMLLFFCVSCATDTWLLVSYSLCVLLGFTNGKEWS